MNTKVCKCCGIEFSNTLENFYIQNKKTGSLKSICKKCHYLKNKQIYLNNKESYETRKKEWRLKNADKLREQNNKNYQANKGLIDTRQKEWRLKNIEKCRETWRKANKKYKDKNRDAIKIKHKEWVVENNYYRAKHQRRRALTLGIMSNLTLDEWNYILDEFNHRCAYCGEKNSKLTQDHFIPLSKYGEYTIHNIIPACKFCNSSKKNKDFEDWYPKQEFYTYRRYDFIKNHFCKLAMRNGGWGRQRKDLGMLTITIQDDK